MKPLTTLLLLATIGFTWSCSKDISPNEGTKLLRVESDYKTGNFQSRTYKRNASDDLVGFRDSSENGPYETLSVEYGANGRISKVNFHGQPGTTLFHYAFEYNTDGRVSKRQAVPGTINIAEDYNIYTYDAAGRLVADSQFAKRGPLPQTYQLAHFNKFIYTGDNVTEAEYYNNPIGGQLELQHRMKYEYDNMNNPYEGFEYLYFIEEANSAMHHIVLVSAGNVVKQYSALTNTVYELAQIYKYQYNSSGYPWKVKHEIDLNGQGLREGEFFYKQ